MTDVIAPAVLGATLGGVLSLLVPALIAVVPEPATDEWADEPGAEEKTAYAAIAARPGLRARAAGAGLGLGALLGWGTGLDWSLVWLVALLPVCLALAVIDWHTRLLPRVVVVPATLATVAAMAVVAFATGAPDLMWRALIAMLAVRTFFWVLWFVRSAGMGFGDVRLAALVGLVLGWVGWGAVVIGVWVGFVAFVIPGVTLAVVKRDRTLLKKPFPYGPFMLIGALVGLVWGTPWAVALWG